MTTKDNHEKINYVELPSSDFAKTKAFFAAAFGWAFVDYGEEYMAFENAGLDGGFYHSDKHYACEQGAPLIVFYSESLGATQSKIEQAGGAINVPIFSFPGGRRFHFTDTTGNEYAVWSDKEL